MDYGTAFTFITKDENWISKAVMAAVFVLLLPFLGLGSLLLIGWAIAVARHVINGEKETLPEWSELGQGEVVVKFPLAALVSRVPKER